MYMVNSAVAVCCTHGRRTCLRALLTNGTRCTGEVLSLEEVLAEGAGGTVNNAGRAPHSFTKAQQRALQDAMYYAAETDHLGNIDSFLTLYIIFHCILIS